jgi:NADH:ubiquinone oxidoreductase subunit F (NADH-binding)
MTPARSSDSRLLVADGSCGRCVGSEHVISALRAEVTRRNVDVEVVSTGCDGRCFEAVAVTHVKSGHIRNRWTKVIPMDAPTICATATDPSGEVTAFVEVEAPNPFYVGQRRVLFSSAGSTDPECVDDALARGAFSALRETLAHQPEELVDAVDRSGLRGMGGAFFPTARKWRACAEQPGPRYLVVNAEEGEPGVFKDRHLIEENPHRLVEGALIAAYAIGASHVYMYINGQAQLSSRRLQLAVNAAREHGLVGNSILESSFSCEIELREGAGGYVLGEESVILESIEGRRPVPRFRPPHVVEHGLWERPTVIDNVETLSRIPSIISGSFGSERTVSPTDVAHTKLVCVSGDVLRPGVVEIPFGTSLHEVVIGMAGGPPDGGTLKAVLTAGPSGKIVPPALFDRQLSPQEHEVLLGSGNLIALDERRSLADVLRRLARFNADESCGKCTPCRVGAHRLALLIEDARTVHELERSIPDLLEIGDIVGSASLCGLGRMAPNPILSTLEHFSSGEILQFERS